MFDPRSEGAFVSRRASPPDPGADIGVKRARATLGPALTRQHQRPFPFLGALSGRLCAHPVQSAPLSIRH